MRAIIHDRYGPVDLLTTGEIERPSIGDRDVLVRVHAAGLNVGDLFTVLGSPFVVRLSTGLRRPKAAVPGMDLAGVVEEVGREVTRFRPGDEVFGATTGSCAEYASVPEDNLALKPAALSFEEAAAIPTAGLAALHGLRDAGRLRAGQRVLINGASGGVGTFEVQIARAMGAEVTGVCSTRNVEMVRSIGADHVVDYTREDFTLRGSWYDLVMDNIENRSLSAVRRVLTPRGTLVLNSGTGSSGLGLLRRLIWPIVLSPFVRHSLKRYLSSPNPKDLAELARLADEGRLRPVIDRTYPLSETADALRHVGTGHTRGKVVVAVVPTQIAPAVVAGRSAEVNVASRTAALV